MTYVLTLLFCLFALASAPSAHAATPADIAAIACDPTAMPTAPDTLRILRPIPSRMTSTAFILAAAGDIAIIDTGVAGNAPIIATALKTLDHTPATRTAILLTHVHPDHTGSAADVVALTQAPVYAHHADAGLIEAGIGGRPNTPKPDWYSRFLFKRIVLGGPQTMTPCAVTHRVDDDQHLPLCGGLDVIALPGHSLGHVGYLHRASGNFFAGDAMMNLFGPRRSRWHEDEAAETTSLARIASLNWHTLHIAHGKPIARPAFDRWWQTSRR